MLLSAGKSGAEDRAIVQQAAVAAIHFEEVCHLKRKVR